MVQKWMDNLYWWKLISPADHEWLQCSPNHRTGGVWGSIRVPQGGYWQDVCHEVSWQEADQDEAGRNISAEWAHHVVTSQYWGECVAVWVLLCCHNTVWAFEVVMQIWIDNSKNIHPVSMLILLLSSIMESGDINHTHVQRYVDVYIPLIMICVSWLATERQTTSVLPAIGC